MNFKLLKNEMVIEIFIFVFGIVVFMGIALFVYKIVTTDIPNYQSGKGVVQFKKEIELFSEDRGVILEIHKKDFSTIKKGETIVVYRNQAKMNLAQETAVKLSLLEKELERVQFLFKQGLASQSQIDLKKVSIEETRAIIKNLESNELRALIGGKIYFVMPPSELEGRYIEAGTRIATIYNDDTKVIKVRFNTEFVNRFTVGNEVKIYYKEPFSLRSGNFKGSIGLVRYNKEEGYVELTCTINDESPIIENLLPGTVVNVSILINSSSLLYDLTGMELPQIKERGFEIWKEVYEIFQ